ncbi:DUF4184 family protein [Streptacidiphilus cavernicola]|uniref:DUF4184 family protein n=1 Tax=Streptacidiphilus cavernicola TaxID=3342716 RepID=A0ABV6W2Q8_9ACTN
MPFTFSHPAAVLPLITGGRGRGRLVASALVAGSLAPDAMFFADSLLPGSYDTGRTLHRLRAVPTLDVAVAAALVAGWHGLLREPLTALLPDPWADRADAATAPLRKPGSRPTWQDAAWFAGSAALGAATHIGWDSFTHRGCAGVRLLPVLDRDFAGMPGYQALQWGTSAVGLGALALAGSRVLRGRTDVPPRRTVLTRRARRRGAALVAAGAVAGAAHRCLRDLPTGPGRRPTGSELVAVVSFGGGTGALLGAALHAAATRLTSRPNSGLTSAP